MGVYSYSSSKDLAQVLKGLGYGFIRSFGKVKRVFPYTEKEIDHYCLEQGIELTVSNLQGLSIYVSYADGCYQAVDVPVKPVSGQISIDPYRDGRYGRFRSEEFTNGINDSVVRSDHRSTWLDPRKLR